MENPEAREILKKVRLETEEWFKEMDKITFNQIKQNSIKIGKCYCSNCDKKTLHKEEGIKLICLECRHNERRLTEEEVL